MAASVVAASVVAGGGPTVGGFTGAFAVSAGGVALAFVAALAIPTRRATAAASAAAPGAPHTPALALALHE